MGMNCKQSHEQINHWQPLSGQRLNTSLKQHLDECEMCHTYWQQYTLTQYLRDIGQPIPPEGLESRILSQRQSSPQPQKITLYWRQMAVAAMLLITLSFGFYTYRNSSAPPALTFAVVEVAVGEVHNLRVMVATEQAFHDAVMTVKLPQHIALAGYQGVRELNWTTNLKPGNNMMTLPIELLEPVDGVIHVKVEHHSIKKYFSIDVRAKRGISSVTNTI